jgi:2-polyprenyl-3-methyl-5-hydroxy-6-metoxy-1,4-benzoquinol methylase
MENSMFSQDVSGIYIPAEPVRQTAYDNIYDEAGLKHHLYNQAHHFWQRGRMRFILRAFKDQIRGRNLAALRVIDIGGGGGGWIRTLKQEFGLTFGELALSDASLPVLHASKDVIGDGVNRYQANISNLPWRNYWDAIFLLDVLEHIEDDVAALKEVKTTLRTDGWIFVATPALKFFWSGEDVAAGHFRRYSKRDFAALADKTGLKLLGSHYFMFFLSPLIIWRNLSWRDPAKMTKEEIEAQKRYTHIAPSKPINTALKLIFSAETPLGLKIPFPWGSSILGIFRKEC